MSLCITEKNLYKGYSVYPNSLFLFCLFAVVFKGGKLFISYIFIC